MIISVGYRIKSHVTTRFRIWATQKLTEFIKKGFVLDDERLKNPDLPFDYFEELERRIQDIRTSERRFYQKITDIYATSIDYDPTLDSAKNVSLALEFMHDKNYDEADFAGCGWAPADYGAVAGESKNTVMTELALKF